MKNNCGTKEKAWIKTPKGKKDPIEDRSWLKKLSYKKCFEIDSNVIAEKIFDT